MKGVPEGEPPRALGSSQVRKIGQMMKSLLDLAEELGAINKNLVKSGDVPLQPKAERRYLKVWEIDAILAAAPTDAAKLLLRVLLMTGLRPGEAKGLKVRDLDASRGRLVIRRDADDLGHIGDVKTYKHCDVPIGGRVLDLLSLLPRGAAMMIGLFPTNTATCGPPPDGAKSGQRFSSTPVLATSTPTDSGTPPPH